MNQLNHCDMIINVASTMTLEGFAVDKPCINIGFSLGLSLNARYPMDDYYKSRHYRDVVESGAARLVEDYEQLFQAIDDVLDGNGYDRSCNDVCCRRSAGTHETPRRESTIFLRISFREQAA